LSVPRPPTQVIHRNKLAAEGPSYVAEAMGLLEKRDYQAARSRLEAGLATGGRSVEALLGLAEAFWDDPDTKSRDPKRSIDHLKEAIQLAPKDARPYALLGRYLLSKGLRDQALNFLDRAIQLDPKDGASRRLRDRASLQKKKAYTVVYNPNDADEKKPAPGAPQKSLAQQHKREATRFLQLDPKRAAEELEKAEHGEQKSLDRALAALLGAALLKADVTILEGGAGRRSGGSIVRTAIAFFFVVAAGLGTGALLQRVAPTAPGEGGLLALVRADSASSLQRAIESAASVETPDDIALAALAHALLLVDHGADEGHLQTADDQLAMLDSAGKRLPTALLARALVATRPLAETDNTLDDHLKEAADSPRRAGSPWLLMARAERARTKGNGTLASELLARAALGADAPPRALYELARGYAARGELGVAEDLFNRLLERHPRHPRGHASAVLLAAMELSRGQREDDKPRIASSRAVKRALKALDEGPLEPDDAAPVALAIAALASATGETVLVGQMLQRTQERGVGSRYPGLLAHTAQLILLDVGDFSKAESALSDALSTFPGEIDLLVERTRTRVAKGLSGDRIRRLRTNAKRALNDDELDLPLGHFEISFAQRYLPLVARFDARYFPEEAIRSALDVKGITSQAAERRLAVVANLKLAEIALAQGDLGDAADRVKLAKKDAPSDPEVHLTEALVQARQGNAVRARDAIEEALRIAPDDPRILLAAGRLQLEAGDSAAARRSLGRVEGTGFISPAALSLSARLAAKDGRVDAARDLLRRARELAPTDPTVLVATLLLEHETHDLQAAYGAAQQLDRSLGAGADRFAEASFPVQTYLAWARAEGPRVQESLDALEDILEERSGFAEAHYARGRVLAAKGDVDASRAAFTEAQKLAGAGPVADAARLALGGAPVVQGKKEPNGPRERPGPKKAPRGRRR
jgi:tetratricopeptide (TPR) repeat protein